MVPLACFSPLKCPAPGQLGPAFPIDLPTQQSASRTKPLNETSYPGTLRFMRQLVEARIQAGSSKMRRTGADGGAGGADAASSAAGDTPASARRGEDFNAAARVTMQLASSFVLQVRRMSTSLGFRV